MLLNRQTAQISISLLLTVLVSACDGSSEEIDQARKLAEMGQVDLAVTKIEQLLAEDPELAPAYEALGDIHMQQALTNPREGAEHAKKAAAAWEGAQKLSEDEAGKLRAKRALALALGGDRKGGAELAKEAWSCCKNPAVLSLTRDDDLVLEIITGGAWTLQDWQQHPAFQKSSVESRTRYIVKPSGAPVLPLDSSEAARHLDAFAVGSADTQSDGFLQFVDRNNPEPVSYEGYVTANSCRRPPRAGSPCEAGRKVGGSEPYIYAGPCWWTACNPGEEKSERVNLRGYQRGSATCVGGPIAHKSNFTGEETCRVTYNIMEPPSRRIPTENLWLIPPLNEFRTMEDEIELASNAGLNELADNLAQGKVAVGMPRPFAEWAVKGDQTLELTEDGIVETTSSAFGSFTFTNGVLTSISAIPEAEGTGAIAGQTNAAKRAECPGNLDGIKIAQMAYDAAFDTYVAVERYPRETPNEEAVEWGEGNEGFRNLGWAPDGPVRGVYWVELKPGATDFEAHALCDVDGDGKSAHYVATKTSNARMLTENSVY